MNEKIEHAALEDKYLKSNVSQAFWYDPILNQFKNAKTSQLHTNVKKPEEISWFDKLFERGIKLQNYYGSGQNRALSMLITGPPGSGKSTLAMELCYRWATIDQIEDEENKKLRAMRSIYITSESNEDWLIKKAESFGWEFVNRIFVEYQPEQNCIFRLNRPLVPEYSGHRFQSKSAT